MPVYTPLRTNLKGTVRDIQLLSMRWKESAFSADFAGIDGQFLRIGFSNPLVVRVLDHISLRKLENGLQEGASARFFAYRVFAAPFYLDHVAGLEQANESARHYRFIVADQCLDVISVEPPAMRMLTQV